MMTYYDILRLSMAAAKWKSRELSLNFTDHFLRQIVLEGTLCKTTNVLWMITSKQNARTTMGYRLMDTTAALLVGRHVDCLSRPPQHTAVHCCATATVFCKILYFDPGASFLRIAAETPNDPDYGIKPTTTLNPDQISNLQSWTLFHCHCTFPLRSTQLLGIPRCSYNTEPEGVATYTSEQYAQ